MATFLEHCADCERLTGDRCEEVNQWIDACWKQHGPLHRFERHHVDGVREATALFGDRGRKAALVHILKDCGRIPTKAQWLDNSTDTLGIDVTGHFNGFWEPDKFDTAARRLLELRWI